MNDVKLRSLSDFCKKWTVSLILVATQVLSLKPTLASSYSFGSSACKSQGSWTSNALSATRDLMNVVQGLRNAEGCGTLASTLETYLNQLNTNLKSVDAYRSQTTQISSIQEQILASRQYSQDPHLGAQASRAMVSGINELAALSLGDISQAGNTETIVPSLNSSSSLIPNLGEQIFRVGKTGITLTDKILDSMTTEQMKCISSPNLIGPFFTAIVQLGASMVNSGQDFFGKDVSSLVNKITSLARNTHFDRISRDMYWLQYQNSMSCLIDTLSEGYCSTLDAQILFNEEMKRSKPISWAWDLQFMEGTQNPGTVEAQDFAKLKQSIFEGYYVLTQQLPVVTAFLERIQRGIPPKNHSDATFQNKIQSNTFNYFLNERNIIAEWNEARTTIAHNSDVTTQKSSLANALKKLAHLIVGSSEENSGINFLERVTNYRKVMFQLMGKEIPSEVVGKSGMQIKADDWLDANYEVFISDPSIAMDIVSQNLEILLNSANRAAVEYYNYWFIADQPGLMMDSLTGMTYNIPEALEGIRQYLVHFSQQDYVDASVLPAVYETIEKVNRILAQYELLRKTGLDLKSRYGNLDRYNVEERTVILQSAITQYKDLIEIFYNEFIILKARSSFLVNRLTSFVKIDYQKRLHLENVNTHDDSELLRQIYYATGDVVFERMRMISSSNPAEIDSDLNLAQRTYLESLRGLEDLIKDNFIAAIAQLKMELEGTDSTTSGIFEDSIIRANMDAETSIYYIVVHWFNDRIYERLPEYLKPDTKRQFNYILANKVYGTYKMIINPDRYPGISALNPVRLFTKAEAPGIHENANHAIEKTLALFCIQALTFRDQNPFKSLCNGVILKSPMVDSETRLKTTDIPYLNFLDVSYNTLLTSYLGTTKETLTKPSTEHPRPQLYPDFNINIADPALRQAKNFDARVCALRQRNRNNYIMYLTQGQYVNRK